MTMLRLELWLSNDDKPILIVPYAELLITHNAYASINEIFFSLPYELSENYYTSFKTLHMINYSYGVSSFNNLVPYHTLETRKTKLMKLDSHKQRILF